MSAKKSIKSSAESTSLSSFMLTADWYATAQSTLAGFDIMDSFRKKVEAVEVWKSVLLEVTQFRSCCTYPRPDSHILWNDIVTRWSDATAGGTKEVKVTETRRPEAERNYLGRLLDKPLCALVLTLQDLGIEDDYATILKNRDWRFDIAKRVTMAVIRLKRYELDGDDMDYQLALVELDITLSDLTIQGASKLHDDLSRRIGVDIVTSSSIMEFLKEIPK